MKKIGVLSDTHGFLSNKVFDFFKDVDEIWHAGDVGNLSIINDLNKFKITKGVYGNIDSNDIKFYWKEFNFFKTEEFNVLITHIAGKPNNYNKNKIMKIIEYKPDIIICGHSHILNIQYDNKMKSLWINPGACGNHGFHSVKTLVRFEIENKKIFNLEILEFK